MIDASAGGSIMKLDVYEAYDLYERIAENQSMWPIDRKTPRKTAGRHNVDAVIALATQMEVLTMKMDNLSQSVNMVHQSPPVCEGCGANHNTMHCPLASTYVNQSEEVRYAQNFQRQQNSSFFNPGLNQELGTIVGQIAAALSGRAQGILPSNTETNPKDQVDELDKTTEENQIESSGSPRVKTSTPIKAYVPPIPFPQRLQKHKLTKQFQKFLDVFKKVHINIPFAEALAQMPSYTKIMKDILSKKRKLEDNETVMLTEECSAILQHKLPLKLKDQGSFTIPCNIGNLYIDKALRDLGASINLMPLSLFRKLGLGEAKVTTISLQLADRSIKHPRGICEDIFVKADKFIFPLDFIILDMEEDQEVSSYWVAHFWLREGL
ncbi:uncharacterized protein LOC111380372 [Olea europaea var. sylvestris]|uniref:uncharacterized protein LOC111380372 n=1 Tax=Olea europaea var. sylvestris TaxID=158386 RepID=UPI000C1D29D4|nr:uncharacterized protein LOC111380372 [Olea europaea var. sylvestris]